MSSVSVLGWTLTVTAEHLAVKAPWGQTVSGPYASVRARLAQIGCPGQVLEAINQMHAAALTAADTAVETAAEAAGQPSEEEVVETPGPAYEAWLQDPDNQVLLLGGVLIGVGAGLVCWAVDAALDPPGTMVARSDGEWTWTGPTRRPAAPPRRPVVVQVLAPPAPAVSPGPDTSPPAAEPPTGDAGGAAGPVAAPATEVHVDVQAHDEVPPPVVVPPVPPAPAETPVEVTQEVQQEVEAPPPEPAPPPAPKPRRRRRAPARPMQPPQGPGLTLGPPFEDA